MSQNQLATSTFDLLARVRAGDESAFTLLFHKYSSRLAVLIRYKLSEEMRARVEVDDILQETFLAASRSLSDFTYRNPGSFMNWLARIADHVIIDTARYQQRQKRQPDAGVTSDTDSHIRNLEPRDSVTPSRIFARKERIQQVIALLDSLPEDYRTVILLAKVEGKSTQEIADRLNRSREAVAVLLHRATQRLKELKESGDRHEQGS
ncbi:MAG: sigma-70 family RNA polymerase sigma factor [Acidobacteriia bacterium]|nr:sigma-70 family RNA polymerase sigma factor [Terriglobia bacterium]